MYKLKIKTIILAAIVAFITSISCNRTSDNSQSDNFTVQITDKPLTFCNPLNLLIGSEKTRRAGEPVIVLHKDDYFLFVSGGGGYWYSDNMRDWTYIAVPNFPGGCPSVASDGETLFASGDKTRHDVFSSTDPKSGIWTKVGEYQRDYGDANMFIDDDGRFYMYWGWSQLLPFQVVELDPDNYFKEKGEPVTIFFSDSENHGFERKRKQDVQFELPSITSTRPYYPEELPWIEGPWMIKHNGKYYLQYAAVGLEYSTYSHGIYVSDNPLGPFEYSKHNPLTFKNTGYILGAGHGSTFHDKNGNLWTVAMVPLVIGGQRGGGEIVLFPTAVDNEGVMHSNTIFGDYPQYYPGIKENPVDNNFAGWILLSNKKRVEASSVLQGFDAKDAVDENVATYWCAETGQPGEFIVVDLGKECEICALQVNFDQHNGIVSSGREQRRAEGSTIQAGTTDTLYQCYTIHVSNDNKNWSMLIDKSYNSQQLRFDYTEIPESVKARYVKLTNVFSPNDGLFAVKDLRIFGNPDAVKFTKVNDMMVARDPEDTRNATISWQPSKGADGYIVRYGIEPDKLYNGYIVYDEYSSTIHSLNSNMEYFFEVESYESGTDYYNERISQTMGSGAEIELHRDGTMIERKMTFEGINEYVFEDIVPGQYSLRHSLGPVMWRGELTNAELRGSDDQPTVTAVLSDLGIGTKVTGQMEMKVVPGKENGKLIVILRYD